MIESELHYRTTKTSAAQLEAALMEDNADTSERDAILRRMTRAGVESLLCDRYTDLLAYERDHPNVAQGTESECDADPGWSLIRARIMAGIRQDELAQRLGLTMDEMRRLERDRYAAASLELLQRIAAIIGARVCVVQQVS
ncbi:MAG: helix-turn-helix transcriptional regulator [Dehalococcoidia bacterium]